MTKLQAHRGVSSEFPENTILAFDAAVRQGYDIIECDPKYTSDGELVILHDRTINRTARKENGESFEDAVSINSITLSEARSLEYGSWFSPEFKGERIPTFNEMLDFAEHSQIPIKIDNVWESFPTQIQDKMLDSIRARENKVNVGVTCAHLETLRRAAETLPDAPLHYDGGDLSAERLERVAEIAKGHPLYIWVCFDNQMTKWFKGTKVTKEVCDRVRAYGNLGIWILSRREELIPAIREFDAQIIETTGHIKPLWVKSLVDSKETQI